TEDLDAYDSDYDDVSTAQAILIAILSNYCSDVMSEVPHYEPYHHDMDNQSVHAMQGFEQTPVVDFIDNEITTIAASRFPSTNNQLRTSSNLRNQATIQDGRVTVQQVQGRKGQSYNGIGYKGNATSSGGNNTKG
nr:hypothetical protein [Tanacetum cinerariifolium]